MQQLLAIAVIVAPLIFHAASETSTTKLLLYRRDIEIVDDVTSQARQVRSCHTHTSKKMLLLLI